MAEVSSSSNCPDEHTEHVDVVSVNDPAAQAVHAVAESLSSSYVPAAQAVHVFVVSVNDPAAQSMHGVV